MYQISVNRSDYSDISLINTQDQSEINIANPSYFYGFYDKDIVEYENSDKPLKLLKRNKNTNIPGILELFGTYSFKPNKRGVPGYLFRPLDRRYPIFIVRSKLKRKSTQNQIVTIEHKVGSIIINAQGIAQEPGQLGQKIWVSNFNSGKKVLCWIKNDKKVTTNAKVY